MDIKEFSTLLKARKKELQELARNRMPVIAGKMAKDHFQENFRLGGFVNGGLHPWPETKRLSSGGTDAGSNYGTLLSSRKHLYKSIKYIPGDGRVKVANELVYAPTHNWGDEIPVTPRMRRFAWAKYYEATGKKKKPTVGKKTRKKRGTAKVVESPEAKFWKRLALTKKKKLKIPQRQFLGESKELTQMITERTEKEIRNVLNL